MSEFEREKLQSEFRREKRRSGSNPPGGQLPEASAIEGGGGPAQDSAELVQLRAEVALLKEKLTRSESAVGRMEERLGLKEKLSATKAEQRATRKEAFRTGEVIQAPRGALDVGELNDELWRDLQDQYRLNDTLSLELIDTAARDERLRENSERLERELAVLQKRMAVVARGGDDGMAALIDATEAHITDAQAARMEAVDAVQTAEAEKSRSTMLLGENSGLRR